MVNKMIDQLSTIDLTALGSGESPVDVDLPSGLRVRLDVLRPSDADLLEAGFARMSARSRYLRFFTGAPHLTAGQLAYFLKLDDGRRWAVVAFDRDRPSDVDGDERGLGLGVASYTRTAHEGEAEVAVVVLDEVQGQGLGTLLLAGIAAAARERGITSFVATVLAENRRLLALAGELGAEVRLVPGDRTVVEVVMPLPGPQVPVPTSLAYELLRRHAAEPPDGDPAL